MEELLRPIYQEWASRCNTLGILLIEKNEGHETVTDTFDALLLVIVDLQSEPLFLNFI